MKQMTRIRNIIGGATLSLALILSSSAGVLAQAGSSEHAKTVAPPKTSQVSGNQDKPAVAPGTRDAKKLESLGSTKTAPIKDNVGKSLTSAQLSYVSGVNFQTPLNYCWKNLVYTPVKNTTGSTQYIQVVLYDAQGTSHTIYTSVSANSTSYPAFYGIEGAYYAYLYVWNGSTYTYNYDEYVTSTNTCQVGVTRVYNTSGWVELKIQNTGTAYATQQSTELAPYSSYGTYTGGAHYDYPAAGGAAIYRWFYVGYSPYGIVSNTYGSTSSPYLFTGDL